MARPPASLRPTLACFALMVGGTAKIARADVSSDEPAQLPRFFVPGDRVGATEIIVPRQDLRRPEPNLGAELLAVPGVFAHGRAADAMEPSIRGLGFDRVTTTLNGLPLVNASPERTNSPVVIVGPTAVASMIVTKALPSVTHGAVTTGGAIALATSDTSTAATPTVSATTGYDGARNGVTMASRARANAAGWEAVATAFRNDLGDYRVRGHEVAATFVDYGNSVGIGWRNDAHQFHADWIHRRLRRQATLSLPLDGKNTDSDVLTFTHHWSAAGEGALKSTDVRAGYSTTDPYITSEDRRAPALTFAVAHARSVGAGIGSAWRTGDRGVLAVGLDYATQNRRAIRTTAGGNDYIWPNAWYEDCGAYAEWNAAFAPAWHLRLGGRVDNARSDARDADQPALGQPLRTQFVTYNGAAAAVVTRRDTAGATNLLAEWNAAPGCTGFVGAGMSVQPAAVTERYRALLNALGGDGRGGNAVELGNPALSPERKWAVEAGATARFGALNLEATAYLYRIADFILRTPIGTMAPAAGSPSSVRPVVVFGYRNIDAAFAGTELGATLRLSRGASWQTTFARATGRNRSTDTALAEIPPWEATSALRYTGAAHGQPLALEIGTSVVAAKANPAPFENPLFGAAGGFAVWHVRLGTDLGTHVKLQLGAENLFDRLYSEYLTPPIGPVAPASGNLRPGDRVPAVGRSLWSSVTFTW